MEAAERRLRPLDLGDLLDAAFSLYRENFALFAGIVAVLGVPQGILGLLATLARPSNVVSTSNGTTSIDSGSMESFIGLTLGSGVISLLFGTLTTGALAYAVSQRYLGRDVTIGEAYSAIGFGTFFRLLGASILAAIAIVLGLVLLIVPGIILLVHWLFLPQTIVIERSSVGSAFGRSWNLVKGSAWRVVGIGLVIFIIVSVIGGASGGILAAIVSLVGLPSAIGVALQQVVSILIRPFELGALTLLYYDLRIRKEGFDLEHMARTMDLYASR
jgi:hypothetical protein